MRLKTPEIAGVIPVSDSSRVPGNALGRQNSNQGGLKTMSRRKYVLALSFIAATGAAYADQQADSSSDEAVETVEVTGIRHAIQTAIQEKKNSGSIVEAITAEDIGKLPDTSIAESISRLPGLTSQRANGRASAISLRGTDPAFTSALLNGREQVSTGDNRSIEFDQYPSELLS